MGWNTVNELTQLKDGRYTYRDWAEASAKNLSERYPNLGDWVVVEAPEDGWPRDHEFHACHSEYLEILNRLMEQRP